MMQCHCEGDGALAWAGRRRVTQWRGREVRESALECSDCIRRRVGRRAGRSLDVGLAAGGRGRARRRRIRVGRRHCSALASVPRSRPIGGRSSCGVSNKFDRGHVSVLSTRHRPPV
eukprot:2937885-Prymnesium_polylepis.2